MDKKKKILFYLATKFGWLIILLLGKLSFIKLVGRQRVEELMKKKVPIIYVLWHGRFLIPIYVHRNEGITPMVSLHSDGEMIAQSLHKLGYRTVRGSSTRGGNKAFHEMIELLYQGGVGTMIPDGPRGPRHYLKPGTLHIAQQTGAYLVPVSFSAKRRVVFNSWDRFLISIPLSKTVMIYGEPVKIPHHLSQEQFEQFRLKLQEDMIQLEKQADEYFQY